MIYDSRNMSLNVLTVWKYCL